MINYTQRKSHDEVTTTTVAVQLMIYTDLQTMNYFRCANLPDCISGWHRYDLERIAPWQWGLRIRRIVPASTEHFGLV